MVVDVMFILTFDVIMIEMKFKQVNIGIFKGKTLRRN